MEKIEIECRLKASDEDEARRRLKNAKSSDEIYVQRKNVEEKEYERTETQKKVTDLMHIVEMLKIKKNELKNVYERYISQVELVYDERYRRYAEYAVKKINEVNGLKYSLEPIV